MNEFVGAAASRRRFLTTTALAGVGLASGGTVLSACGDNNGGATADAAKGAVTWASWANPGEAERFKAYSKSYEQTSGTKITYQQVVGDNYLPKLVSQLAGGAAPDAFYVDSGQIAKLIETKQLLDLSSYLASANAPVKESDFFPGLMKFPRPADGAGLYGVPVDCNPRIFWFNADVLAAAGVTQTPAQLFEAGRWNQDAMTSLLDKVRAGGKRGLILEGNWFDFFGWITTFGGTAFDSGGRAVFDTDPKAQAAVQWLFDQLASGNITYGGSLPQGQGVDALFYAGQLATITYGRWILPNLKKLKFGYDIAPLPSASGKEVMPVPVGTAVMSINVKAKNQDAALAFLGHYVSKEGQKFRLSGGGNAVPSINGLDEVVTEGNLPAHGALFTEVARKGYAIPLAIARNADISVKLPLLMDQMLKAKNETPKSFSQKLVRLLNGG